MALRQFGVVMLLKIFVGILPAMILTLIIGA